MKNSARRLNALQISSRCSNAAKNYCKMYRVVFNDCEIRSSSPFDDDLF